MERGEEGRAAPSHTAGAFSLDRRRPQSAQPDGWLDGGWTRVPCIHASAELGEASRRAYISHTRAHHDRA